MRAFIEGFKDFWRDIKRIDWELVGRLTALIIFVFGFSFGISLLMATLYTITFLLFGW